MRDLDFVLADSGTITVSGESNEVSWEFSTRKGWLTIPSEGDQLQKEDGGQFTLEVGCPGATIAIGDFL